MPFVCWLVNYGSRIHPMFFLPSPYCLCLLFYLFDQKEETKKKEMVVLWLIVDPHFPYELNILFFLFWPETIPAPSPLAYWKSCPWTLRTPQTILHIHLPSKFESVKSSSPWLKKQVQSYISQLWWMFFSYNLKEILFYLCWDVKQASIMKTLVPGEVSPKFLLNEASSHFSLESCTRRLSYELENDHISPLAQR